MARKTYQAPETKSLRAGNTAAPSKAEPIKNPTPKSAVAAYLRPSGMRVNRNWTAGTLSRLLQDICGRPVTEDEVTTEMTAAGFRSEKNGKDTFFDVNTVHIVRMADELVPQTKKEKQQ